MPRTRETDQHLQRLDGLGDELDAMRREIDAARNAAFDRRRTSDRRAHPRPTPDRRIVASDAANR
jgi:hypothetical protein